LVVARCLRLDTAIIFFFISELPKPAMTVLFSPRIDLAYRVAAVAHACQVRKGTSLPYLAHPVHVARLLERAGLAEHVVVAGILHDVIEDLEPTDAATRNRFREVFPQLAEASHEPAAFRAELSAFLSDCFGSMTMDLVEAVTDEKEADGQLRPWLTRKQERVQHLECAPPDVAALKAADVLHNVNSVLQDLDVSGPAAMTRFNAGPSEMLWYYSRVADICRGRLEGPPAQLAEELGDAVNRLANVLALPRPNAVRRPEL
jgi:(p)ppGpp synthase/HD superfamily hydrolase